MGDMEIVRQFNSELSTIYETKPPISKAKVASVTRLAVKAIKYYKHVVQSIEKFAQKCRQEYKVPALYVIDSVIRQSRHQFGSEKDVYGPRFAKNIKPTFQHIFRCTPEEQGKVIKVLNLWQKNGIYPPEVIQPLLNLPSTLEEGLPTEGEEPSAVEPVNTSAVEMPENLPVGNPLASMFEEQQQEHLRQIELLQQKLQEQQRINEQQQQQLRQQQLLPPGVVSMPQGIPGVQQAPQETQVGYEAPHQTEGGMSVPVEPQGSGIAPSVVGQQQPKFQLQPEVYAQIQALTGMNIRMPLANQSAAPDSSSGPSQSQVPQGNGADSLQANQIPGFPDRSNFGPPTGMPVWAPHEVDPGTQHGPPMEGERRTSLIDDFDYGDDDDDASRIAEQRRHLMEEERRLSREIHPHMGEVQGEFQSTFRPVGEPHDRHPDPAGPFGRRSPDLHPRDRSPGGYHHRSRSPRRRSRSPRWRDRSPRRRSRSPFGRERERDRERDRDRDRGRNRDRDRDWYKDRDSDREREKDRGRGSDREVEKRKDWIPAPKKETMSVCSTTIWVGHLAKTVMKENLLEMFEAHKLTVSSIDMVPPRGCAYVVMTQRQDASRVLVALKNERLHGNSLKLAWAPGKGVKGREYKEHFDTEQGVAFIPWSKLGTNVDLQALSEGGWIDPETLPPGHQNTLKEGSEAGSTDTNTTKDDKDLGNMSQEELMKLAAAQAATEKKSTEQPPAVNTLGQPPPHIPPPGPHMFPGHPPMIPPPMMIQPPFPGAPLHPNMVPPGAPPPHMAGVPPPNMGGPPLHQFNPTRPPPVGAPKGPPGPLPNLGRPQEGGQFPVENNRFPPPGRPQDTGQFPPQIPGRPQETPQFPPKDGTFPPHQPGRPEDSGQFPPHRTGEDGQLAPHHPGRPHEVNQFPPHHPGRPQEGGQFPPHHPIRPQDGPPFPHHPGRFPDGHFPPMHHGPHPFHQRPPHHLRMPHFHPGGPRFPHELPPLMPAGGPARPPDFGPPGPNPWGPGPGPMRGPPPHGIPPPGWPETRPSEEARNSEAAEDWNEQQKKEGEDQTEEVNTIDRDNSIDMPNDERDFGRRPRREHDDRDRDWPRDRDRGRDRDDRDRRDRDDRGRGRDWDERFRDRGRDRDRDRERDRDRDRGRDRDREDRRRERDEYRSNREVNGERDGSRDGSRRRSRFEPLGQKPDETEAKESNSNEIKEPSGHVPVTIPQNSEIESTGEEGEILDGNDKKGVGDVNISKDNEDGDFPKDIETVNVAKNNDGNIPKDIEAANIPRDIESINIPENSETMSTPTDINTENIPRDIDAMNISMEIEPENIPKGIENVDTTQGDVEQNSSKETSNLMNTETKTDGEIDPVSSS